MVRMVYVEDLPGFNADREPRVDIRAFSLTLLASAASIDVVEHEVGRRLVFCLLLLTIRSMNI